MNTSRSTSFFRTSLSLAILSIFTGSGSEACQPNAAPVRASPQGPLHVASSNAVAKAVLERCDGHGEWSLSATGTGFEAYEGKRVWLSALERDRSTANDPGVVVLLEGRIRGGAFSFSCAKTLHSTLHYPAYALVVDTDDDGRCGPTDLARNEERYGWNSDVSQVFLGKEVYPVQQISTVVGDRKQFDFCRLYFPASAVK